MAAMIWPWVLIVAVASTPAFAPAAAAERQDPALVRLAEQSGCSGTPRGYGGKRKAPPARRAVEKLHTAGWPAASSPDPRATR